MRDYSNIDKYLDELIGDIYPQPVDDGHLGWAIEFIKFIADKINIKGKSVLDAGCGEAFVIPYFSLAEVKKYIGVTASPIDIRHSRYQRYIQFGDFHFLNMLDESVDIVFSRHTLEHSPMPILALMEWHRVSKEYLCLVLPTPKFVTFAGRNHYSVMEKEQAEFLLDRAGWNIKFFQKTDEEYRFICKKFPRKSPFY